MPEKKRYRPESGKIRNRALIGAGLFIARPFIKALKDFSYEPYKPKAKSFIFVANHVTAFDPGYEMLCLNRYMRYIASDHLEFVPIGGAALKFFGGVIVKHRDRPSDQLTKDIIATVRAGIPVAIHAEGGTTFNGETGFISEHTGQLVKDSGVALITAVNYGGSLCKPRWARTNRKGPVYTKVVKEYSPEELAGMSALEITELIRRDTYVNIYDIQREKRYEYKGEALAEYLEQEIYVCPKCGSVGTLRSVGNDFFCEDCGYSLTMREDGFFESDVNEVIFDNIADWDRYQREAWRGQVESAAPGELIFSEDGQIIREIKDGEKHVICDKARISLYTDRFELALSDGKTVSLPLSAIRNVMAVSKMSLLIITDEHYYDIIGEKPRCARKYVAAWRWLCGKEFF